MVQIIDKILTDLGIECYYISTENIEPTGDYIKYNFRSSGEVYANNEEVRRQYIVYINYFIVKAQTIESKIETLNKELRKNNFLNRGEIITMKDSTGYYNTSLQFKFYK